MSKDGLKVFDSHLQLPFSKEAKRKILWDNCARMYGFN